MSTGSAAFFQCKELLSTERLVMNLRCGLNEVLEMCTCEEVAQIHEFAMVLVFDIDDSPPILATADLTTAHDDRFLRANNGEGNDVLNVALAVISE